MFSYERDRILSIEPRDALVRFDALTQHRLCERRLQQRDQRVEIVRRLAQRLCHGGCALRRRCVGPIHVVRYLDWVHQRHRIVAVRLPFGQLEQFVGESGHQQFAVEPSLLGQQRPVECAQIIGRAAQPRDSRLDDGRRQGRQASIVLVQAGAGSRVGVRLPALVQNPLGERVEGGIRRRVGHWMLLMERLITPLRCTRWGAPRGA